MSFGAGSKDRGIAGGIHARSAVQGIDCQPGVLGQHQGTGSETTVVLGLDPGILVKSYAVLDCGSELVHFRQLFQSQSMVLRGLLKLPDLARVGSCKVDSGLCQHLVIMIPFVFNSGIKTGGIYTMRRSYLVFVLAVFALGCGSTKPIPGPGAGGSGGTLYVATA